MNPTLKRTCSPSKTHLYLPVETPETRPRASSAPAIPCFQVNGAVPRPPSTTSSGDQTAQKKENSSTAAPLQAALVPTPCTSSSSLPPPPAPHSPIPNTLSGHISEQRAVVFRLHQEKTMKFISGTDASVAIRKLSRQKLIEALKTAGYKLDLDTFKKWESTILQTIYSTVIDLDLSPQLNSMLKSSQDDISDEECSASESEYPGEKIKNTHLSEELGTLCELFYSMLSAKITQRSQDLRTKETKRYQALHKKETTKTECYQDIPKKEPAFAKRPSAAREETASLEDLLALTQQDVTETLTRFKEISALKDELSFKAAVKKETRTILASVAAFGGGTATSALGAGVGVATGTAAAVAWPLAAAGITAAAIGSGAAVAAVTKTHQEAVKLENNQRKQQLEVLMGRSGLDHRQSATDSSHFTHHGSSSLVIVPSHVQGKLSLSSLKSSRAEVVKQLEILEAQRETLLQERRRNSASGNTPSLSQSSSSSSSSSQTGSGLSPEIDSLTETITQYHEHLGGLNTNIARLTSKAQSEGSVRRHFRQLKEKLTRGQEHADTEPLNTP